MSIHGRSNPRRATAAVALAAVAALLLAACGGSVDDSTSTAELSFNAAVDDVLRPTDEATGGTLKVGVVEDCDSWDPQRTYLSACWTFQRLFSRGLMAFGPEPGEGGNEVVADLAEGPGEHNDDYTEWTYTLREGVTWDDGSALTSADVRHGIQRLFATDVVTGGPTYTNCLLTECDDEGESPYGGPYVDQGGLDSIETPDDRTITFHLVEPFAGWDYLMALPSAAAVPEDRDTRGRYGRSPASSGPFKVAEYKAGSSITFERNESWSQDSDEVRRPLVDRVDIRIFTDGKDVDQRLERGTLDVPGNGPVQAALQGKIDSDPVLKARADNPTTPFTRMIIASPLVEPLDDVHCRRAVAYAMNKSDLLRVRGGAYGGSIARVIPAPGFPGHDADADRYPSGEDDTGDLDQARAELEECGEPDGFKVKMAYVSGDQRSRDLFAAMQRALDRVGIELEPAPGAGRNYFGPYIGSPENVKEQGLGVQMANWGADFPLAVGFWSPIAEGSQIKEIGNFNWGMLDEEPINRAIADLRRTSGSSEQDELSREIDELVMDQAVMIPYVHDRMLFLRSERVVNAYVLRGTGGFYDVVNMGVQG